MNDLYTLSFQEITNALKCAQNDGIQLEDIVMVPEADIALCRYHGQRFNVHFDLAYGVDIEALDPLLKADPQFAEHIARMIVRLAGNQTLIEQGER